MENLALAKKLNRLAIVFTVVVIALVSMMRQVKLNLGVDFHFLPPFHAILNTGTTIALLIALYQIRRKNVAAHRKAIYVALGLSVLFLLSYVLYHFTTEETRYCGEGQIRYVYFLLLITHIVLAALGLPFILFTFIRGYTNQVERHRRIARWVYWIWLYVAITGPVCYLMLRPCY